jgi:regulator of sigma E protease
MTITIISTIVVLGVLIFVHELGHFLAAKALGVKVERFSLGFPPKLFGRKYGETEYMLSWIPLGGYVKMYGENTDETNEIPPEEQHRSFSHKPAWARFLIVLAGPAFNFLFALLVFWIMFAIDGVPHLTPEVGKVRPDMPAAAAGILPGDKIVSINSRPVQYWEDVLLLVRDHQGRPVELVVERRGSTMTFSLMPNLVGTPNIFGEEEQIPMIGIEASGELIVEKINPLSAIYYGGARTWELTELTVLSVVKLIQGKLSPKTLGGPIFIAQLAGEQARAGLGNLIFLAALLSLNLGILNLLPVPVLDGGHLLFFSLEMIFRKPVSLNVRERAQQVGIVFLILFMVFVFYNDLARIFTPGADGTGSGKAPAMEQNDNSRP